MSTDENEGKGQETGLSGDISASGRPSAGETGQDPLRTEARRAEGWMGVDAGARGPGSCRTGPRCSPLHSSVSAPESYPSLIGGNRLTTDLLEQTEPFEAK